MGQRPDGSQVSSPGRAPEGWSTRRTNVWSADLVWEGEGVKRILKSGLALEELRRDHPQALKRFVFVTAQAHGPEYGPFLRETGAPVLDKPLTLQQLRQIVERMGGRGRYALR